MRRIYAPGSTWQRFASACRDAAVLLGLAFFYLIAALAIAMGVLGCAHERIVYRDRVVHVNHKVPCLQYATPGAPLESFEDEPKDGVTHPRIQCGDMDALDCDAIRRGAWADFGHVADDYFRLWTTECFKERP